MTLSIILFKPALSVESLAFYSPLCIEQNTALLLQFSRKIGVLNQQMMARRCIASPKQDKLARIAGANTEVLAPYPCVQAGE